MIYEVKPYSHQQSALDAITVNNKGVIVIPTGGGKTNVIGWDILRNIDNTNGVVIVVSPRILLSQQLFSDVDGLIGGQATFQHMFVYSGEAIAREEENLTHEQIIDTQFSTTSPNEIKEEYQRSIRNKLPLLIFTTYHSLDRIIDAELPIDSVYLDEAHNAVSISFAPTVGKVSELASRMYAFTATPKLSESVNGRGNNNTTVFGEIICEIDAKQLIDAGCIVPPMPNNLYTGLRKSDIDKVNLARDTIKQTVEHYETVHTGVNHKILVAADGTETINSLLTRTDLRQWCKDKGYELFCTTSSYGDWFNDIQIRNRGEFLDILKQVGADSNKKMVVIHHSILSEGIDVPGLTGCLLLRNMNLVTLTQTIGRVLRMLPVDRRDILEGNLEAGDITNYKKGYGLITLPLHLDDGEDMDTKVSALYNAIMGMGIRPDVLLNEEDVAGKSELTVPEDVDSQLRRKVKEIEAQWQWYYAKNEITEQYSSILNLL